jgi:hypothetical protein
VFYQEPILQFDDEFADDLVVGALLEVEGGQVADYADYAGDQSLPTFLEAGAQFAGQVGVVGAVAAS